MTWEWEPWCLIHTVHYNLIELVVNSVHMSGLRSLKLYVSSLFQYSILEKFYNNFYNGFVQATNIMEGGDEGDLVITLSFLLLKEDYVLLKTVHVHGFESTS